MHYVFRSLYSLSRVVDRTSFFLPVDVHVFCLPRYNDCINTTNPTLQLIRSLLPFLIILHREFNYSLFNPFDAARESEDQMHWLATLAARLFLPWILSDDYIFYVDADTIWGRDFRPELRDLIANHPSRKIFVSRDCSAIRPHVPRWFRFYLRTHGGVFRCFGNSGVIIIRNKRSDWKSRVRRSIPIFNKYAGMWPDQDVLNYMYRCREKKLLPTEWNNHKNCLDALHNHTHSLSDAIIHHQRNHPFTMIDVEWGNCMKASLAMKASKCRQN
jgi:hypothetical protein